MKPGELQRNLSRLAAIAGRARDNIGRIEAEVATLRSLLRAAAAPSRESDDEVDMAAANRTPGAQVAQVGALFK